jgi:hypothetical protein
MRDFLVIALCGRGRQPDPSGQMALPRNLLPAIAREGEAYDTAVRAAFGPATAERYRPATHAWPGIPSYAMKLERTGATELSRTSNEAQMVM